MDEAIAALPASAALLQLSALEVFRTACFALLAVAAVELQRHEISPRKSRKIIEVIARYSYSTLEESTSCKRFISIGAASGDRTHDILSHSQAFCR
jgi:hypothetical protein